MGANGRRLERQSQGTEPLSGAGEWYAISIPYNYPS
jgi:hypothetical protein